MAAFHLIWDLGNFGYIDRDFPYSPSVKLFGHAIAIAFLFIVGVSLVVARARGAGSRAFWRRFFLIAGAAALVSLGTYIAFPQAFVFFGILHCIALASLLAAPLLPLPGRPRFSPRSWRPGADVVRLARVRHPLAELDRSFDLRAADQ